MFCCTHLYLPKRPWVENYNYNSFTPVPYRPKADAVCMLLWIYSIIFSSFQFNFGLAEMKQKLRCLPCGSSPIRRVVSAGTHLCNTYKRQEKEEEEATASLSRQCHHSMGPQHRPVHTHPMLSAQVIHKELLDLISRAWLGRGGRYWFELNNCFPNWLYFVGQQQVLSLTSLFICPNKPSHFLSFSRLLVTAFSHPPKTCFSSTRTWVIHMLTPSSPASNNIVFLCSLHFSPVLS